MLVNFVICIRCQTPPFLLDIKKTTFMPFDTEFLQKESDSKELYKHIYFCDIVDCCSVTQLCPTLQDPMDCSTPGFPVHHHLPELIQTHVHQVGDAIQPSHPLSSSSPAFNLSQHQGLFQ